METFQEGRHRLAGARTPQSSAACDGQMKPASPQGLYHSAGNLQTLEKTGQPSKKISVGLTCPRAQEATGPHSPRQSATCPPAGRPERRVVARSAHRKHRLNRLERCTDNVASYQRNKDLLSGSVLVLPSSYPCARLKLQISSHPVHEHARNTGCGAVIQQSVEVRQRHFPASCRVIYSSTA